MTSPVLRPTSDRGTPGRPELKTGALPIDLDERLSRSTEPQILREATENALKAVIGADDVGIVLRPSTGPGSPPGAAGDHTAWVSLTSDCVELVVHDNGHLATILCCRRFRCAFSAAEIDRAVQALPATRAVWAAMSYRQQTLRLIAVMSPGTLRSAAGVLLVEHTGSGVLELGNIREDVLGSGAARLLAGGDLPQPLRGLLCDVRMAVDPAARRFGPYRLAEVEVDIHAADRGFGGEVVVIRPRTSTRSDHLTARQAEVLALVDKGLSNKEIGTALAVSTATVKKHLQGIFEALGVSSRTAAVHQLHDSGTIPNTDWAL